MIAPRSPALLIALLVAAVLFLATGSVPAHATPPSAPCNYECMWPIGTHGKIPKTTNVGDSFIIDYSYSWDASAPAFSAWKKWPPPPGHHLLPIEQQRGMPEGYTGSTITLQLPQEMEVEDWASRGFEKSTLWIDANGHTTHKYIRLNAHAPGTLNDEIRVKLVDLPRYANTEIVIDLGIRDAGATMPLRLFANPLGPQAISIGERLELAVGQAPDPGRYAVTYPELIMTPTHKWELGIEERETIDAYLEDSAPGDFARGSQSSAEPATAYVYGYLLSADRTGTAVAAPNVRVCLHDVGDEGTANDPLRTEDGAACTHTTNSGFYGLVVPTADPSGDGTADIVARFSLTDEIATVVNMAHDRSAENNITGRLVSLGTTTIPPSSSFRYALLAYADVHRAHEYFNDLGQDAPHVSITNTMTAGGYNPATDTLHIPLSPNPPPAATIFHEYTHHVMHSAYPPSAASYLGCADHGLLTPVNHPCIWGESIATFVAHLISGDPVDAVRYIDFERRATIVPARNLFSTVSSGSNIETNIISALWDLYDGSNRHEEFDNVSATPQEVVGLLFSEDKEGEIVPIGSIQEFRDAWHNRGRIGLDSLLDHNGAALETNAPTSLTVTTQDPDGNTKPTDSKKHVKAGDTIVVSLRLDRPSTQTPTITFAGSAPTDMSVGASRSLWSHEHTVIDSTPEGAARFTAVIPETNNASFSEYAITSGGNAVIDTTPLVLPIARFSSPSEILLDFREATRLPSPAPPFSVTPPSGGPLSIAPTPDTPTAAKLSLPTNAANNDKYTIAIPQTVTDLAGNAYTAGSVMITLNTDDDPLTFSATQHIGNTIRVPEILVTFSKPVRVASESALVPEDWTFTPVLASGDMRPARTPGAISASIDQDRLVIVPDGAVTAGIVGYSPSTARPITDADGNPLLATSAQTGTSTSLTFIAEANRNGVSVRFSSVSGKTNPSEWLVGGKPATSIRDENSLLPLSTSPSGDVTFAGRGSMLLTHPLPTSVARPLVEYVKPTGENANSLLASSGATLQSSSYLAQDVQRPRLVSASFVNPQTISLEVTEALNAPSVRAATFTSDGGLGTLMPSYTAGSTTVTLSAAAQVTDGTVYTVKMSDGITDLAGHGLVQRSFTASRNDNAGPVALDAYFAGIDRSWLAFTVNEALRPGTVTSADFDVTAEGSSDDLLRPGSRASYEPLSRTVWLRLVPHESFDQRLTITIPETVLDVAGNAISTRTLVVPHTPIDAVVASHAFVDPNTIVYKLRAPLDADHFESATFRLTPSLGLTTAFYEEGSFEFRVTTSVPATPGTTHTTRVSAPFGVLFDLRGGRAPLPGEVTYLGTGKPVPLSASSTSTTTTEVRFGVPVQFGAGVTPQQHRLHWTVNEGAAQKTIGGIAAKAGDPLTLVITHDPLSGTSAGATVTYTGTTDDAGRVRDTATPPAAQEGGPFRLVATDGAPPRASSLALSIERDGEPRVGASHARAGDDVVVRLTLNEPVGEPDPRLVVFGGAVDMALASPGDRSSWTGRHTVPASPPQGPALFGITVRDRTGNEATIERASLTSGEAILDTVPPSFAASTRSETRTAIEFAEPVHGALVASDWTVGGVRALGVALVGGEPSAALSLAPQAPVRAVVLTHPSLAGTGATPSVTYLRAPTAG